MIQKLLFILLILLTSITIYLYTTVYEKLLRTTDTNDYVSNVLFKGLFFPILLIILMLYNIKIWKRMNWKFEKYFQIDEVIIDEFEKIGIGLFGIWISSLFLYLVLFIGEKKEIYFFEFKEIAWIIPFILYLSCAIWLFLPFKIFFFTTRFWFIDILINIISSPFHPIRFKDTWICDQITSMNEFLYQLQFSICLFPSSPNSTYSKFCKNYILSGIPFLGMLPLIFRMNQCIRQYYENRNNFKSLLNFLKYILTALSMTLSYLDAKIVSSSSTSNEWDSFRYIWILTSIISTLFRIYWDFKFDWGLLNINSKHYLLRDYLSFPKYYYYLIMISNFIMRCTWIILFYLHFYFSSKLHITFWIDIFAGIIEIFRRSIWNLFQMEYLNEYEYEYGFGFGFGFD
eukprot:gene10456-2978_t